MFKVLLFLSFFVSSFADASLIYGSFNGHLSGNVNYDVSVDVIIDQDALVRATHLNEYSSLYRGGDWLSYSLNIGGLEVKMGGLDDKSAVSVNESVYMINDKPTSGPSGKMDFLEFQSYFYTTEVNGGYKINSHSYSFFSLTDLTGELLSGTSVSDLSKINLNMNTDNFIKGFYHVQYTEEELSSGLLSQSIPRTFGEFVITESTICFENCVGTDEVIEVMEPPAILMMLVGLVFLLVRNNRAIRFMK